MSIRTSLLLAALCVSAVPVHWPRPQLIPIERLEENLEKAIEKHPDDSLLHYNRARLLYLAVANQSHLVPTFPSGKVGVLAEAPSRHLTRGFLQRLQMEEAYRRAEQVLAPEKERLASKEYSDRRSELMMGYWDELKAENWRPPAPSKQAMVKYASQALRSFGRAIELDPKNALYLLGRASLGLQILDLEASGKFPQRPDSGGLSELTLTVVRDQFYRTQAMAIQVDGKRQTLPMVLSGGIEDLISYEAGKSYLEICERTDALAKGQEERIQEVTQNLKILEKLPPSMMITPILFGDHPGAQLQDLLDPAVITDFNLDGLGRGNSWPWVRADTAILVWDPYEEANITSGSQLFGSVSFRLFLRDGYEALRLLDDDGDGYLRDAELNGLALWRDANQDGRSCPREVVPVWREGITAIATRPQENGAMLLNHSGVHYQDGRQLPSFDWVTQSRWHRGPRAPH